MPEILPKLQAYLGVQMPGQGLDLGFLRDALVSVELKLWLYLLGLARWWRARHNDALTADLRGVWPKLFD